jgi:hypothetical protein
MPRKISITQDPEQLTEAATVLSGELTRMKIPHAFIGGFAMTLYGSSRATRDIDVLIDVMPDQIVGYLHPELARVNGHFAKAGLQFYFAPELMDGLVGDELVDANRNNVLIEILPVKSLGLPSHVSPSMLDTRQSRSSAVTASSSCRC